MNILSRSAEVVLILAGAGGAAALGRSCHPCWSAMPIVALAVTASPSLLLWRSRDAQEREAILYRRTQDYVQRLIDVIPQPVHVKDTDSRYLLVDDANLGRRILEEDRVVLAGQRVLKEEHKAHLITGKEERFRVVAKGRCLDADGNPGIVCSVFDVTDWRIAEARRAAAKETAEQSDAAKSRFQANMSPALRRPMHAILSFARGGAKLILRMPACASPLAQPA